MDDPIPVTVLSGALGAGKTTTLNHVLGEPHGLDVAVLVNDVSEVNVDAELVERRLADGREVVELSNGCICCSTQGEFETAVTELATGESFDYLLVEPSGISKPVPVAAHFRTLAFYELDSVTSVVDARQFHDLFCADRSAADGARGREASDGTRVEEVPDGASGAESPAEARGDGASGEGDRRPLSDVIVDGVEFCDAVVLNKVDLVSDAELEAVEASIRTLQPDAEVVTTEYGRVAPGALLDTGRFDVDRVSSAASWKRALRGFDDGRESASDGHAHHDHATPLSEFGVDSFVYHRRRPMHPTRLAGTLRDLADRVDRAKGWLHVAGRPDHELSLSITGTTATVEVTGRWVASLSIDPGKDAEDRGELEWDEEYGDRQTKLVVIGRDLDADGIERALDDCLLTDEELAAEHDVLENPFPERRGEPTAL